MAFGYPLTPLSEGRRDEVRAALPEAVVCWEAEAFAETLFYLAARCRESDSGGVGLSRIDPIVISLNSALRR